MEKTTLVLGASDHSYRYSFKAIHRLRAAGHPVVAVGNHPGRVADVDILTALPQGMPVHTVTLYLNPYNQQGYYQQLLDLKPQRVIFNPGTENTELRRMMHEAGIETREACTLVMLSTGQY